MAVIDLVGTAAPSEQIERHLRSMILTGRLIPGERLPSVRQFARDIGVAPGTVARVYKALENDGLLVTRTGAGTKVSQKANSLPADVLDAARSFFFAAQRHGIPAEEAAAVIHSFWQ